MATVGKITVDMVARNAKFDAGMKRSRKQLKQMGWQARKTGFVLKTLARSFAPYLAGGAIVMGFRRLAAGIDSLAKTSTKLGIATEHLAGLRLAGRLTGIQVRTLDMALQRMTRRVAEAAKGTGEAKAAIKELGLDAVKLAAAGTHKSFLAIAEAMKRVKDPAHRLRLAFKLFDSEGAALVNTLALGADGLRKVQEQAERTGLAVGQKGAKGVEKMTDAFTELGAAMKGAGRQAVVTIAPALTVVTKATTALMEKVRLADIALGMIAPGIVLPRTGGRRRLPTPAGGAPKAQGAGGGGFAGRQMGMGGITRGIRGLWERLRVGTEGQLARAQAGIAGLGKRAAFAPTQFMQADIGRMALQDRVVGTARTAQEVKSAELASLLTGIRRALEKGTPAVAGPF